MSAKIVASVLIVIGLFVTAVALAAVVDAVWRSDFGAMTLVKLVVAYVLGWVAFLVFVIAVGVAINLIGGQRR